jgi:hypothetical protein
MYNGLNVANKVTIIGWDISTIISFFID